MRKRFGILKSVSVVLLACSSLPLAAQQESTIGSDKQSDETKPIDLFYAMEQRQVEVKFVTRGSDAANVIVTNLTKKPIEVQLPGTFAGVPILGKAQPKQIGFGQAGRPPVLGQIGFGQFGGGGPIGGGQFGGGQFGGGGQLGQFGGGQQGGGGGQALGGGFNQNQGGGGGIGLGNGLGNGFGLQNGGRGNGLFRIEMDRPLKISVQTVCLEHGKPDPNPRMKYQLIPLASFTASPEIEVLCRQLSSGNASQKVAQAAAWNIANGLTWEELSAKNRRESQYTGNERFFTQKELEQAMKFTAHCRSLTETEQYVSTSSK